jgi:hypothetical protein
MKIAIALLIFLGTAAYAQTDLAKQANLFLSTLSDPLRAKAKYETNDPERLNWHFVPRERNGVSFRDFNDKQRKPSVC